MEWNALDWLDLVLRWFHVMAGVSWIGGSLYLLWLDRVFANSERAAKGEQGEPWLIDTTGSLLVQKLLPGQGNVAKTHTWFKRETTLTFVSGLLLLVMIAHLPGGGLLTDASGAPINPFAGVAIIAALLIVSWFCYDLLWRTPLSRQPVVAIAVSYALFVAAAWGLTQIFSGRAAFILLGAALGTILFANVWLRILPALKEMSAARDEDRAANAPLCDLARQRATHNSYLIFPTIVLMLSNHYPVIYGHPLNWIALSLLAAAFVGVRHLIVSGKPGLWGLYMGLAALGVAIYVVAAGAPGRAPDSGTKVSFATARGIIIRRCLSCHSTVPSDRTFGPAPGNVSFDTPASIKRHAQRIKIRAVSARTMPNRRSYRMTATERTMLGRWIDQGAKLK